MGSAIRKIGNSAGVILPKLVLETLGARLGDQVTFVSENGRVFISAAPADPRAGWEDDFRALAKAGFSEDDREWLEAPLNSEAEGDLAWSTDEEMRRFEADFAAEAAAKD